jgi:transcriptional regulator with XRE-family HTH domain
MPKNPVETDEVDFAGRLRAALAARGMTQRQLADDLGMTTATAVSAWASGRRTPNAENLRAIASVLAVDSRWLAGEATASVADPRAWRALRKRNARAHDAQPDRDSFLEAAARGVEDREGAEAADYLRLMAFVFEAGRWARDYGWDIQLRADVGHGRVVTVNATEATVEETGAAAPKQPSPSASSAAAEAWHAVGGAADVSRSQRDDTAEQPKPGRSSRSA